MTEDDKLLVERLRWRVSPSEILLVDPPRPAPDRDCHYAADRIEAQAAEIERLRMQLKAAALWTAEPGTTIAEIRAAFGDTK